MKMLLVLVLSLSLRLLMNPLLMMHHCCHLDFVSYLWILKQLGDLYHQSAIIMTQKLLDVVFVMFSFL
jgi:hypothetical protein